MVAVIARRKAAEWFIGKCIACTVQSTLDCPSPSIFTFPTAPVRSTGAIHPAGRTDLEVALSFLPPGVPYTATLFTDARPDLPASHSDPLSKDAAYSSRRVDAATTLTLDVKATGGAAVRLAPAAAADGCESLCDLTGMRLDPPNDAALPQAALTREERLISYGCPRLEALRGTGAVLARRAEL